MAKRISIIHNKFICLFLILCTIIISCKKQVIYDNDEELCEILAEMTDKDQRIRKMDLLKTGTKAQKDSLWAIQNSIDVQNTELLIEVTKQRGWINGKMLGCDRPIIPVAIFRHTPEEYFQEVSKLLKK